MSLRCAVTGSGGQLGRCLVRRLEEGVGGRLAAAYSHAELDIADEEAALRALGGLSGGPPEVLLNAAAYNAVDACEDEGAADARAINARAPGGLARVCESLGTRLVHVSTDYVFPGDAKSPIPEDAAVGPRTAYGRSKLDGEQAVALASPRALIVRTSWVFGPGRNFVGAILRQGRLRRCGEAQGPLRVVDDQRGYPTYADDLAEGLLALSAALPAGEGGVFHLSNGPDAADDAEITWWDFARAVLDAQGFGDLEIDRIATAESGARAPRPAYSVLSCEKAAALGVRLRSWREALAAFFRSPDLATTRELSDPQAPRA